MVLRKTKLLCWYVSELVSLLGFRMAYFTQMTSEIKKNVTNTHQPGVGLCEKETTQNIRNEQRLFTIKGSEMNSYINWNHIPVDGRTGAVGMQTMVVVVVMMVVLMMLMGMLLLLLVRWQQLIALVYEWFRLIVQIVRYLVLPTPALPYEYASQQANHYKRCHQTTRKNHG